MKKTIAESFITAQRTKVQGLPELKPQFELAPSTQDEGMKTPADWVNAVVGIVFSSKDPVSALAKALSGMSLEEVKALYEKMDAKLYGSR